MGQAPPGDGGPAGLPWRFPPAPAEAAFQRQVSGGSDLTLSPRGCPAGDPSVGLRTSGASTAVAAELRGWGPGSWGGLGVGASGWGSLGCGGRALWGWGGQNRQPLADTTAQGFLQTSFFFQILDVGFSGL